MRMQIRVKPTHSTRLHLAPFVRSELYNAPRKFYRNADGVRVETKDPEDISAHGAWCVIVDRGDRVDVLAKRFKHLSDAKRAMKALQRQGFNAVCNRQGNV